MKALVSIGILAFGVAACGDKESPQEAAQQELQKPIQPTGITKSKPSPRPRSFDASKATEAELAARRRLEESLEKAAIAKEKEDARRAEERAKRIAQMTEQITTRFREGDANGDGLLSQDELPEQLARRFADGDTNSDGFLNAAEQEAMLASIRERLSEASRQGGRRDRSFGGGGRGDSGGGGGRDRGGRGRDR